MPRPAEAALAAGRTRLSVGERETRIETVPIQGESRRWMLPVGTQAVDGRGPLRHDPPTALEIERAIEQVEDVVMPLLRQLPPDTTLHTGDAAARVLLDLAREHRAGRPDALSLDDVEQVFNALAALSQGRPLASSGWPPQPGLAAYLVILREVLHHLRFTAITLD